MTSDTQEVFDAIGEVGHPSDGAKLIVAGTITTDSIQSNMDVHKIEWMMSIRDAEDLMHDLQQLLKGQGFEYAVRHLRNETNRLSKVYGTL